MFTCGLHIPPTPSSIRFIRSKMVVAHVTPVHPVFLVVFTSTLFVLKCSVRLVPGFGACTFSTIVGVSHPVGVAIFVHLLLVVFGASSTVDGARDSGVHCAANRVVVVRLLFNGVQSLLHHIPEITCS